MQRAEIIAKGKVQKVGYRDYVVEVAANLNVNGTVENLDDGRVKIVAEAEKEVLDRFIELLKPKEDPLIKVIDLDIEFVPATEEFEYFDINYGDFQKEGFERIGDAARILKQVTKKQDQTINIIKEGNEDLSVKQNKTIEILREGTNEMRESRKENKTILQDFHQDTIQRFDMVDIKYGKIAENMEKILQEMKEERKEFRKSIERLIGTILEKK